MALKQFSNAAEVNLAEIPSDVYGIIAKILLRAANENENCKNVTSTVAIPEKKKHEFW